MPTSKISNNQEAKIIDLTRLDELIQKHQMRKHLAFLKEQALQSIDLYPYNDDLPIPVGASKLGGHPDMPEHFDWPRFNDLPLSFMAQINLSSLPNIESITLSKNGTVTTRSWKNLALRQKCLVIANLFIHLWK